jgi:hypothetical protein
VPADRVTFVRWQGEAPCFDRKDRSDDNDWAAGKRRGYETKLKVLMSFRLRLDHFREVAFRDSSLEAFGFERGEKAFQRRGVVASGFATHTGRGIVDFQRLAECNGEIKQLHDTEPLPVAS